MQIQSGYATGSGSGSGVIISEDGYIVTNNHVVENATSIKVYLQDGTSYDAEVIGTDPRTDSVSYTHLPTNARRSPERMLGICLM